MVKGRRISVVDNDPAVAHAKLNSIKMGIISMEKPKSALTVSEAVDRYIDTKDSVLSPSTLTGYKRLRDNQMREIADERLCDLTQELIQRWVNRISKDNSPKTVRNAHGLLTSIIGAYRPDMMVRTTLPQKQRFDVAIPTEDDIVRIISTVRGTENEIAVLLAIWLGLRMSEVLGLKWTDIDGDILHIRRAMIDEGEKATKTFSSQRDLPIPGYIKSLLDSAPRVSEYIVNIKRKALYSRFQTICKHADVSQHYRFHDLRHINASVMLALGVPNKYAQQRMGHSTENMLKTVYQHTMQKEQIEVAEKVDDYFGSIITHEITHEK